MFLPTYTDQFGQVAQISMDLSEVENFIWFDPSLMQLGLRVDPIELGPFIGLHKVKMELTDSTGS